VKQPSVTVVGSLSVDFVMRVPRRPNKGETIAGYDFNSFVGGKGNNQALAAARAGARVRMVGRVGNDAFGDKIVETLKRNEVDTMCVFRDPEVGTGIANIYIDPEGDNSIVIVPQSNGKLSARDIEVARDAIGNARVVLLQMEIPDEAILAAARAARAAGAIVALNPAPAPPAGRLPEGLLENIDIITPNQSEAELLTGLTVSDRNSARQAALKLQQLGAKSIIITMGEQGAYVLEHTGNEFLVPSYPVVPVDTTAAGDAFCGALAAALASDKELKFAVQLGCAAGAIAVTVSGAEPSLPSLKQIEQLAMGSVL
jgi:ribokinase